MGKQLQLTAVIDKEDDWFVALCPELDVASQGRTKKSALENLREAVELYLEDEDVRKQIAKQGLSKPIVTKFNITIS